jgi:hypothetical protein
LQQKLDDKTEQTLTSTSTQQTPTTSDLSAKAGEIASYIKDLFVDPKILNAIRKNKPVELPKEAISKIRKKLEGEEPKELLE